MPSNKLTPKEPSNEAGKTARQQYLDLAKRVIGEAKLDYATLYQRFAENDWASVKLDDAVAALSLKAGNSPKQTVGILHQSPYLQYQVQAQQRSALRSSERISERSSEIEQD